MSVLANGGVKNEKTLIMKIEDAQGRVLEEFQNHPKNVLDPQAVYQLTSIMTDNDARSYIFGSRSPLVLPDRVVAAKTGTTQSWKDGWTMGFTPSLAVGVWAGNNDGTLMKTGADGVYVAAPIWNTFMKEALKDTPAENFSKPAGIQEVAVDSVSGKLPTNYSPATKLEVFADYNVPTTYDNVHVGVPYDTATDQPADSNTPADRIVYKTFTIFHSERPDNPDWENPVFAWAQSQGYVYPPGLGNWTNNPQGSGNGQIALSLIEPKDNSTISQLPFKVAIAAISPDPISKIEVSIDGQLVKTLTSSPYVFEVNKSYADGNHTLAVKATDAFGKTSDTSVNLNFAFTQPLALLEPAQDSLVLPPVSLRAESANQYSQINFYYQPEKGGSAVLIGSSDNVTALEGKYQYSLTWSAKDVPSGSYLIFARTNNGTTTTKVKISLP
jgi:membrane carboxypeptidase/penicillin-binding protein PbpC